MTANDFPLVAVMLGWPAVLTSVTLVFVGIARRRVQVAVVGSVLGLPFLLYLFASPRVGWLALVVGAVHLGSPVAVARSGRGLAVAMATPFAALAGFVGWIVLNQ